MLDGLVAWSIGRNKLPIRHPKQVPLRMPLVTEMNDVDKSAS